MDKSQAEELKRIKEAIGVDFLERDGKTYVHQRKNSIDWSKEIPSEGAYSEKILSLGAKREYAPEEMVIMAHGLATRLLESMDLPNKVRLVLNSKNFDSCTDKTVILASTKVLDDKDIDLPHRLDAFLGTVEHEGLHVEFTDFNVRKHDQLAHCILNIIEDERIEHLAGEKYPGLAGYLKFFKYYFFEKFRKDMQNSASTPKMKDIDRFINELIVFVRYPSMIMDESLLEWGDYFIRIHDLLKDWPQTTAEALDISEKIMEIIKDLIKEDLKKQNKKSKEEKSKKNNSNSSKDDSDNSDSSDEDESSGSDSEDGNKGSDVSGSESENENEEDSDGSGSSENDESSDSEKEDGDDDSDDSDSEKNDEKEENDSEKSGSSSDSDSENDEDEEDGEGEDEESEESDSEKEGEDGDASDSSCSSDNNDESSDSSDENGSDDSDDSDSEDDDEEGEDEDDSAGGDGNGTGGSGDGDDDYEPSEEEIEDIINNIVNRISDMLDSLESETKDEMSEAVENDENIDQFIDGAIDRSSDSKTTFINTSKPSRFVEDTTYAKDVYNESLSRVRRFIPAMKNILVSASTTLRHNLKGCREGHFDTYKLAEAYQGSQNVYMQVKEEKSDRIAVCILVDESGSMWGNKIQAARDTAVLLNEALGSLPTVDLYIYGHTADYYEPMTTQVFCYRDKKNRDKYALGQIVDRSNNADGYAILETAKRVRSQTAEKVLFFVISDGQPASYVYCHSENGIEHTRKAVKAVEKMGFVPVQISIEQTCEPELMFDNYIKLTNIAQLPKQLAAIVRKAVLSFTTRK